MTDSLVTVPFTHSGNPPPRGICVDVEVVRVLDGDTVEVEVKRRFIVRLQHPNDDGLIYDTPPVKTPQGKVAKEDIDFHREETNLMPVRGTLFVGSGQEINLFDMTTFGRVIGAIWVKGQRLTQIGLDSGFGRLIKKSKRKSTPWPWEENDEDRDEG